MASSPLLVWIRWVRWIRTWLGLAILAILVAIHLDIHCRLLSTLSFHDADNYTGAGSALSTSLSTRPSFSRERRRYIIPSSHSQEEDEDINANATANRTHPWQAEENVSVDDNTTTNHTTTNLRQIQNRTIMFIHVGKTGGSTLQRSFLPKYWKKQQQRQSNNLIRGITLRPPTCHTWDCPTDRMDHPATTTLLFAVRNPVDRLISAYKFSHPDNCITRGVDGANVYNDIWGCHLPKFAARFYVDCAPTLEDLANVPFRSDADLLLRAASSSSTVTNSTCRESVRDMVAGRNRKQSTHAYFNYAYYKNVTIDRYHYNYNNASSSHHNEHSSNNSSSGSATTIAMTNHHHHPKEIFVIRNEHLWDDASSLDRRMGGNGTFPDTQRRITHGSERYHNHTSFLSSRGGGYENLCCLLADEIDAYEGIVRAAENLMEWEKDETVREVERKCGIFDGYSSRRAWEDSCRDRLDKAALSNNI